MAVLYIAEPGASLVCRNGRLEVVKGEVRLSSTPEALVEAVLCVGPVQITPAAMASCLERGADVALLRSDGRYLGRIAGERSSAAALRRQQLLRSLDAGFSLDLARRIAAGKIRNQRAVLARQRWNGYPVATALLDALAAHARTAATAASHAALRGVEGAAARAYFAGLRDVLPPDWASPKRSRRPPADPFNALLSYCYALLQAEVFSAVAGIGLDPSAGFLHADRAGRPGLVLDLMEEFRAPFADRCALACLRLRLVTPEAFQPGEDGGLLLAPSARKRVIARFARMMTRAGGRSDRSPRAEVVRQARRLADFVRGGETYAPYRHR